MSKSLSTLTGQTYQEETDRIIQQSVSQQTRANKSTDELPPSAGYVSV